MLAKDVLTEEWLADVLQDSLEMDWTTTDGARAIMRALEAGLLELPQTGGQIAALATTPPTTNDAIPAGDTVAFVQEWLMNADYDPSQFDRDFAAAIDARVVAASAGDLATLFCAAPLPDDVCADQCATVRGPGRTGTNLLTVDQATRVFTAALSAAPSAPATEAGEEA